jgi:hypothetical protein
MIKTANVGNIDRAIRLIVGVVLIVVSFVLNDSILSSSVFQWLLPLVGLVLVATALFRFCPLYRLIGKSTCKAE